MLHGARRILPGISGRKMGPSALLQRMYHSYPDPNEKPQVSAHKADGVKVSDKTDINIKLAEKFQIKSVFPGIDAAQGGKEKLLHDIKTTTLSNGLQVISQDNVSLMTSFAFMVKTGSAYEKQEVAHGGNTGVTHVLEFSAFRSTEARSSEQISSDIENIGGMAQCISTRDNILYCLDVLRENVTPAIDILAETVLQPAYPDEELEYTKESIEFQREAMPAEQLSRDAVVMAAFKDSALGNHHFCPSENLESIDATKLQAFRAQHFFGSNCIIACSGMNHDDLVKLVESRFGHLPKEGADYKKPTESTYRGGLVSNERELQEKFIKIAMGFKIGGWHDDGLVAACVLQQLLGGGSSFSAGGPGKGMYTRLYREVLNRFYWVESAESFISVFDEAGLLGIDGACAPESAPSMLRLIIDQLCTLAVVPVSDEELSRAKNMLKSMMMMQLESRLVLCEDLVRQYSTYGSRESPEALCKKIDAITQQDLMDIAGKMIESPPSIGCVGHDLSKVPPYEQIEMYFKAYKTELAKKYTWNKGGDPE